MKGLPAETESVLELLAATPRRIASLSREVEISKLHFRPRPDSWSANDVLAHLRACADVWGKSIMDMITRDRPKLRYISPRSWIRKTDYLELEFQGSLKAFTDQRRELLRELKGLAIKDWLRSATFTGTTKGGEQTVLSYACRIAYHENKHCDQIEAVLKLASAALGANHLAGSKIVDNQPEQKENNQPPSAMEKNR
jgi:DinB superfamily